MKRIIIPIYWGFDGKDNYTTKIGNYALSKIAEKMVNRIIKNDWAYLHGNRYWYKSMSFKKYFVEFKRTCKGKKYDYMYLKSKNYVWGFAVYLALLWGYDRDSLEMDWEEIIYKEE